MRWFSKVGLRSCKSNLLGSGHGPSLRRPLVTQTLFGSDSKSSKNDEDDDVQLYSERRLLGYSKHQMFKVVSEVENYHQFVPWCKESKIIHREERKLKADLVIGFPPIFGESYRSHVSLFEPFLITAVSTDMTLFRHLKSVWKFQDETSTKKGNVDTKTCLLDFAVSFQFRHNIHSSISKLFFDEVIRQNVKSFLNEAQRQFGPESIPRQNPKIYAKR